MIRFLQVLLVLLLARVGWRILRALFVSRASREFPPRTGPPGGAAELRGEVVRCERCDLHVPGKRAEIRGGRTFCSAACADRAAAEEEAAADGGSA